MLRDRSNCKVIVIVPMPESEVIWVSAGIDVNCVSRGVAIADAIVCGLAPG